MIIDVSTFREKGLHPFSGLPPLIFPRNFQSNKPARFYRAKPCARLWATPLQVEIQWQVAQRQLLYFG